MQRGPDDNYYEMDPDMEGWSPIPPTPSPLPTQHSRLIGKFRNAKEKKLQNLAGRVLSFEVVGSRGRLSRGRRQYWSTFKATTNALYILIILAGFAWCWMMTRGISKVGDKQQNTEERGATHNMKFFSSLSEDFRYVGRWTQVTDQNRTDGSFPGVYFEISVSGTRTIVLSLHNRATENNNTDPSHACPISLLVLVDDDEYVVVPNASSLVRIRPRDLDPRSIHTVRIIAPMTDVMYTAIFQLKGIWLDKGGELVPISSHRSWKNIKTLEIVTDSLFSNTERSRRLSGINQEVLSGVTGWQYLLGEMFTADHVRIGMDGMCLIQNCIGGRASPLGIGDVFFQSGPHGTEQFFQPWHFEAYVPDVMVMELGSNDWQSFRIHSDEYEKTTWNLTVEFEDTYVTLIKAIRALAYPNKPTNVGFAGGRRDHRLPLPIFVMRPFRGQLEQATQSVVSRLRLDGDEFVFWLDTSGWVSPNINVQGHVEDDDFFLDKGSSSMEWRLTERGHRRVAMLLHMHVCRFLAADPERCAFLPPTIYEVRSGVQDADVIGGRYPGIGESSAQRHD